ncbi:MAG: hypothetical protein ACRC2R_14655 [Xenococcaceae cyanobacterium]
MRKINKLYLLAILSSSLIVGCSQSNKTENSTEQKNLTVKAALVVKGDWELPDNIPCSIAANPDDVLRGKDPFLDNTIRRELKVTVKNSQGDIVNTGSLDEPKRVKEENSNFANCAFYSNLEVPISNFYTISIGSFEQTFSRAEIEQHEAIIYTESDRLKNLLATK